MTIYRTKDSFRPDGIYATHSDEADHALSSDEATHATNADSADEATHATSADSASDAELLGGTAPSGYVSITGPQTILGVKTFSTKTIVSASMSGSPGSFTGQPEIELKQTYVAGTPAYNVGDYHSLLKFSTADNAWATSGLQAFIAPVTSRFNGQGYADAGLAFGTSNSSSEAVSQMILDGNGKLTLTTVKHPVFHRGTLQTGVITPSGSYTAVTFTYAFSAIPDFCNIAMVNPLSGGVIYHSAPQNLTANGFTVQISDPNSNYKLWYLAIKYS